MWKTKLPLDFDSLKSYSPDNHNLRGKNISKFRLYLTRALTKNSIFQSNHIRPVQSLRQIALPVKM